MAGDGRQPRFFRAKRYLSVYNDCVPTTAIVIGLVLIVLGAAGFVATGSTAKTALIPAGFGAVILLLGVLARNPQRLKLAMHIAVVVALLGFFGALSGPMQLLAGTAQRPAAAWAQTVMALLMAVFIALAVKSFIDARRAR
jgi:hypothetical protein